MRAGLPRAFFWLFARFDGRIGREIFWLANILLVCLLGILLRPSMEITPETVHIDGTPTTIVILLLGAVSSLAVAAKRFHDVNLTGLAAASLLVPVISILAMIVIGLMPGTNGPNRFGAARDVPP